MKKKSLIALSVIAGLVALWIVFKIIPFQEIVENFHNANPIHIIFFLISSCLIMIALAWKWKVVLKSQNIKIPFSHLFAYRLIGYGISYLTPSAKLGGEPVRAALLSRHGIKFSRALSSVVIDKTIEVASSALFFFIGVLIVLFKFALPGQTEITMLLFAIVFLVLMIFVYHRMASGKGFIRSLCKTLRLHKIKKVDISEKKLEEFEKRIIKFFKQDKKDFLLAFIACFVSWIFMFLEYKMATLILGYNLSFTTLFLIISFVGAAFIIPIPMAMGTLEASQIAVFTMMSIKSAAGVALAFIIRIRDLLWSIIGMLLLSYYGVKISKTIEKSYINSK
ncbi:flippase-like domain-containing protein [Candidatus Woesearchaeota archaeon]|nr:flippase-like domain-containing protein [Candidatus Woesearchaeota archaeon]